MKRDGSGLTRREFLGLTGGLVVLFSLPGRFAHAQEDGAAAKDLNAWLHIGTDGQVTVFAGKVEIGQGVTTTFAQMAAEELTVPFESVKMVLGDTDRTLYDGGTYGSESVRELGVRIRAAAAKAREVLTEMAAERWGVSPAVLVVKDGRVTNPGNARFSLALAEVTGGKRITRELKGEPKLRPPQGHQTIGKSVPRVDGPAVVTGEMHFVGDLRLPAMLYGAVLYPPTLGARLTKADTRAAKQAPGVVAVVQEEGLVGVVADLPETARKAVGLIQATWEEASHPSMTTLYDDFRKSAKLEDTVVKEGAAEDALKRAHRVFAATYQTAYLAHAALEPHTALAHVQGGKALVYSSTQTPFPHRDDVAKALKLDGKQVHVIAPRVGGGFGGRENSDVAVAAARLSRAVGRPVLVSQTRAEAMTWNYFKPAALIDIRAGVDEQGQVIAWDCDIYNCGDRGAGPPYGFANQRVRTFGCDSPLAQGSWRGLAGSANVFAIESHMDQMANELGQDPVQFRRRHLENDPRLAKVVRAAAGRYGWQPRTARTGKGIGFACAVDAGSCVAEIAEVEVDRSAGTFRVTRVVASHENGLTINPDGVVNQVQGGITMGLGMVLQEAVRYERGRILTTSYSSYHIPTVAEAPAIEVVLVPNPEHPPQGVGEPAIFPIAAAVSNAVFDATGARVRELPVLPERVKEGMKG